MISVFDIFKIGIGPSSSHTVGPMKAGKQFTDDLIARNLLKDVTRVVVDVYGSLSLTGKGHHTDIAIIMGLAGNLPDTVDIDSIPGFIQDVNTHGRLMLANGQHEVEFPVDQCMNFHADNLSLHENGMRITALAGDKIVYSQTYYSIGGGFIVDEEHFGQQDSAPVEVPYPYSFSSRSAKTLSGNRAVTLWPDDEKRAGAAQQRRAGTAPGERLGSHAWRY
ncbi:L-serine dehydratase 2 [Escherichia coli]|uniref:L-serine ammonia-lyase n=1 Tax=Escherichia coli TaxID=562 RepID=A0A376VDZ2_ECOLX|nr:L-serine dehydratase 2 [Escherichia coli]